MKRLSSDYEGRCGNCHKLLADDDQFCRYCGTPKGEGGFLPYENSNMCVYGPPVDTTHTCTSCGYSWNIRALGVDNARFCPRCGSSVDTTYEDRY
ncbi:MAG: zinc-ribbon domain-containing protein [Clostridiales bacterium]|nr:zinc-ribbon domain-containing protein [Clostridiales bacterium]